MSYRFGAEYRALSWLPLRAGVAVIRRDPDRRDAAPPLKGFLGTQIDASYSHEHVRSTPGDPGEEISRGDQATIVLRYLF